MRQVTVFQNRLQRIRNATSAGVTQMWDSLPDYHQDKAEPFAAATAPVVAAGQLLAARTTNAYLSRRAGVQLPRISPSKVTAVRKGVSPLDVYQRPFGVVWGALAENVPFHEARDRGRERLGVLAVTDIFLAMRATFDEIGQQTERITGWVRVADNGACDLCAADDGAPYEAGDDMAGHPGCGCTLEPVFGETDSEPADPEATETHDNDELGPVLYEAGHSFGT